MSCLLRKFRKNKITESKPTSDESSVPIKNIDNNYKMALTKKALLVGINYIGTSAELSGCINDVINMRRFLVAEYGFKSEDIITLTDADDKMMPTTDNIFKYISWLMENNNANSRLFFHYSGHGSNIRDKSGDETDGRDETLVPLDYETRGVIVDDKLSELLVVPLNAGAKLTVICDSCHSGTILDLRYDYRVERNLLNTVKYSISKNKQYKEQAGGVILLSGCRDDQTSADSFEAGKATGAMTYCFLETMKKLKAKGKTPTLKNVISNLQKFIKVKGYTQVPQLSSNLLLEFISGFSVV